MNSNKDGGGFVVAVTTSPHCYCSSMKKITEYQSIELGARDDIQTYFMREKKNQNEQMVDNAEML